jgi:ATP-dependent Clp protease ATP-binding subunit ClpA
MEQYIKPRWLRDLLRFLPLKSQFVLSGNVKDLQTQEIGPGLIGAAPLIDVLAAELKSAGFAHVLVYEPITGIRLADPLAQPAEAVNVLERLGIPASDSSAVASLDILATALDRIVTTAGPPTALIIDFASRLIVRTDYPAPPEHQLFTRTLVLTQTAKARPVGPNRQPLFNTVLWVVDKEGDLPDWLVINNPRLRHIPISKPDRAARRAITPALLRGLTGGQHASDTVLAQAEEDLVDETEGLLLTDLNAIVQLGRSEQVEVSRISDAVRRYKVGVTDDPWRKIEKERIRSASTFVTQRVIGQDHAVTHMLDIVKRASTGISGTRRGGRPRGVAFLAGPTGVGKTELAKTITELLFGDESAYIRFDMSEFSAEHADQRLIGAPPGYVGYDVGGELTNAIRDRPFSVVLFDEIEKAHPRILDKFLQVLDDGVLTSGRGDRVYFSEALIVFTSNLGIYSLDSAGARIPNVTADQPFEEVRRRVRLEIENHFKLVLNRPEILNRIGENIIVFDFIRPEIAAQIFDHMVQNILSNVAETGHIVTIAEDVKTQLRSICLADLAHGGRGIRNQLEAHLINPLARALFEQDADGGRYQIAALESGTTTTLKLVKS